MWYTGRVSHTQNSSVGKNGSINLELVKSLLSLRGEEEREEEKETGSVDREREEGRERLENTQQQSNSRN